MSLFKKNKKNDRLIGVDIGTSNLKLLEVFNDEKKGQIFLETYGLAELQNDIIRSNSELTKKKIAENLKELVARSGALGKNVATSVPGFSVFSTVITIPPVKDSEIAETVKWEGKKFVPFPIEEMSLDWRILNKEEVAVPVKKSMFSSFSGLLGKKKEAVEAKPKKKEDKGEPEAQTDKTKKDMSEFLNGYTEKEGMWEVFLIAVPKNIVSRYMDIFSLAGLNLISLEPETVALTRAIQYGLPKSEEVYAIMDMGSTATEIIIVQKGLAKVSRNIDIGGNALTTAIANSLKVDRARAEKFKRELGLNPGKMGGQITGAARPVMDKIVEGVNHTFSLYYNTGGKQVDDIVLSGGGALLKGLDAQLSEMLNIKVSHSNPWENIATDPRIDEKLKLITPAFSVSLGLSLRDFVEK